MTKNLVTTLRRAADGQYVLADVMKLCDEAADKIERLTDELLKAGERIAMYQERLLLP